MESPNACYNQARLDVARRRASSRAPRGAHKVPATFQPLPTGGSGLPGPIPTGTSQGEAPIAGRPAAFSLASSAASSPACTPSQAASRFATSSESLA